MLQHMNFCLSPRLTRDKPSAVQLEVLESELSFTHFFIFKHVSTSSHVPTHGSFVRIRVSYIEDDPSVVQLEVLGSCMVSASHATHSQSQVPAILKHVVSVSHVNNTRTFVRCST